MSLDALFSDRRSRKYIRDSINNASDVGKGSCSICESSAHLLEVFGKRLCEGCCEFALRLADNYGIVFESASDEDVISIANIDENYVIPDMAKLQNDADSKFNGSIADLLSSYGITPVKDWDDKLSKGRVWIAPKDIKAGKGRVNKFLIDYSCQFVSKSDTEILAPDPDGTIAPLIVKGQLVSKPLGTPAPTPAPASSTKTSTPASKASVSPKSGYVLGNSSEYRIQVGNNVEVDVLNSEDTPGVYWCQLYFKPCNTSHTMSLTKEEYDDIKKSHAKVMDFLVTSPGVLFDALEPNSNTFEINRYSIYKFAVDEYSFGSQFTVVPVYNGKKHTKIRIALSDKALSSKVALNAELTAYMDTVIGKKYPALVKGNKVKTSIGTAVFELESIEPDADGGSETLVLSVDLSNYKFTGRVVGSELTGDGANNAFAEILVNAFAQHKSLIPGFRSPSIVKKNKPFEYEFSIKYGAHANSGETVLVYAAFDMNHFYDTGEIAFFMSIIDSFSGVEQPKQARKFVYRKVGVNLEDFLSDCAKGLYDEFFAKSDMTTQMKDSAVAKMRSASKKASLLRRIGDALRDNLQMSAGVTRDITKCDIDLDMKVNSDGKVTSATFTVSDPFEELTSDSQGLKDILSLEKKTNWIKVVRVDARMEDGPTVVYKISDIEEFSKFVNLPLFENAILEAFGISLISESRARKVINA